MNNSLFALLLGYLCFPFASGFAQSQILKPFQQGLPTSPTAAGLGKFIAHPVSLSTGSPQIEESLLWIQGRQLGLGLDLEYDATGVKVDDVPSWLGLKWSLQAGGIITRVIKGLPDDAPGGWLESASQQVQFLNQCGSPGQFCEDYRQAVDNGWVDPEPDEFFINLPGLKGKFVLDAQGNPMMIPFQAIKIHYQEPAAYDGPYAFVGSVVGGGACINQWTITDLNGIRYEFSQKEVSTPILEDGPVPVVSSWYLSRMISPDQREEIRFTYRGQILEMRARDVESKLLIGGSLATGNPNLICQPPSGGRFRSVTEIYELLPDSIIAEGSYVKFFHGDRDDLTRTQGQPSIAGPEAGLAVQGRRLDSLRLYIMDSLVQQISLFYTTHKHRMYLDSLQRGRGQATLPPLIFRYHQPQLLPEPVWTYSTAGELNGLDYWGYFNGKGQQSLIPTTHINLQGTSTLSNGSPTSFDHTHHFEGADRSPDLLKMTYGQLSQIINPMGGSTSFEFEAHDYHKIAGLVTGSDTLDRKQFSYVLGERNILSASTRISQAYTPYLDRDTMSVHRGVVPPGIKALTQAELKIKMSRFQMLGSPDPDQYARVRLLAISSNGQPQLLQEWNMYDLFLKQLILGNRVRNSSACAGAPVLPVNTCLDLDTSLFLTLVPGTYQLEVSGRKKALTCDCDPYLDVMEVRADMEFRLIDFQNIKVLGGGLRIKSMRLDDGDLDHSNDIIRRFYYTLPDKPNVSSGVLANYPRFTYNHFMPDCYWLTAFAQSQVLLGTTSGNLVSYQTVVEQLHEGESGKTISRFSTAWEYPDEITSDLPPFSVRYYYNREASDGILSPASSYDYTSQMAFDGRLFPYAPVSSNAGKRGDLLNRQIWNANGNLVQETQFEYAFSKDPHHPLSPVNKDVMGLYMHFFPPPSGLLGGLFMNYTYTTEVKHLARQKSTQFGDGGNTFQSSKAYFYERPAHALLTRIRSEGPSGELKEERFKYPLDYQVATSLGTGSQLTIGHLIGRNMLAIPLEVQSWRGRGNGLKLVNAELTTFQNLKGQGDTLIRPFKRFGLVSMQALSPAQLNEGIDRQGRYTHIIPNLSYYQEKERLGYESSTGIENLYQARGEAPVSLIWGPEGRKAIAQVRNALAEEIAYTGFESARDGEGGWAYTGGLTKTKTKVYAGNWSKDLSNNPMQLSHLPAGKRYLLSFWGRYLNVQVKLDGNLQGAGTAQGNWKYYEFELDLRGQRSAGQIEVSGTGYIDEVRLHPVDADMKCVSYGRGEKVLTLSGEGQRLLRYRYDEMGRLRAKLDHAGKYLEAFEYHYRE